MNQIGTPLPALSPPGGERVAEGRERGGSWRAQLTDHLPHCLPVNLKAPLPKQTSNTFSIELFRSRNVLISVTAKCAARSIGNPYAPVLMDGNAIVFTPFCSARASEFR